MLRRTLHFLLVSFLLLVAVLVFNTLRFSSVQVPAEAFAAPAITDSARTHFQQAIRYRTISHGNARLFDSTQFIAFRKFLERSYPLMHTRLERQLFERYSLLYTWPGRDTLLQPVVVMAHQDVVPVEEATRPMWTADPFGGEIRDGFIWGRGTTDDKINLISIFEATEKLLAEGFQPDRTVYFVFGHDEEIGGKGALAMARYLQAKNIQAAFVLDEGGIVTKEKVPGITQPVALLGTAEKGYLSLVLRVELPGGHSSMPEKETAIDVLSKAVVRLRARPFEALFSEPVEGFIRYLGPEMPWVKKMAFANPWLFKPVIAATYEKTGAGNAMIRTTFVPTILESGIKDNVVPTVASATLNFRMVPGHSAEQVMAQVKAVVADHRVQVEVFPGAFAEASRVTSAKGFGFRKIAATMQKSYPETLISPFLMIGATDSRHFGAISTDIIKFSPIIDPIGFHGIDERVSLESYRTALWFYEQLLRDLK